MDWKTIGLIARLSGKKAAQDAATVMVDGGAGSGNFGHAGRKGKRGGSTKRGSGGGSSTVHKQAVSAARAANNEKFRGAMSRALQRMPSGSAINRGGLIFVKKDDGNWHSPMDEFSGTPDPWTSQALGGQFDFDVPDNWPKHASAQQVQEQRKKWADFYGAGTEPKEAPKEGSWRDKLTPQLIDKHSSTESLKRFISEMQPKDLIDLARPHRVGPAMSALAEAMGLTDKIVSGKYDNLDDDDKKLIDMITPFMEIKEDGTIERPKYETDWNTGYESHRLFNYLMLKEMGMAQGLDRPKTPEYIDFKLKNPDAVSEADKKFDDAPDISYSDQDAQQIEKRTQLRNAIRNHPSFEKMHPRVRDAITGSIATMSGDVAKLFAQHVGKLDIETSLYKESRISGGGNSFCSGNYISLSVMKWTPGPGQTLDNVDSAFVGQAVRTFWHEVGHFIDNQNGAGVLINDEAGHIGKAGVTTRLRLSGELKESAKTDLDDVFWDVRKYMEQRDGKAPDMCVMHQYDGKISAVRGGWDTEVSDEDLMGETAQSIFEMIRGDFGIKTREQFEKQNGYPPRPKMRGALTFDREWASDSYDMIERVPVQFDTYEHEVKWKQAYSNWRTRMSRYERQHPELQQAWATNMENYREFNRSCDFLNDILAQLTGGQISAIRNGGGQHSKSYYESHSYGVETTANMFEMFTSAGSNHGYMVEVMKKRFPSIYNSYKNAFRRCMQHDEG